MRKSRLRWHKQRRLLELFGAGATARTAASFVEVNKATASDYCHRLRQLLAAQSEAAGWLAGAIESDESYLGLLPLTSLMPLVEQRPVFCWGWRPVRCQQWGGRRRMATGATGDARFCSAAQMSTSKDKSPSEGGASSALTPPLSPLSSRDGFGGCAPQSEFLSARRSSLSFLVTVRCLSPSWCCPGPGASSAD